MIVFMLETAGVEVRRVKSTANTRIERPWGDLNVKVQRQLRGAFNGLVADGLYDDNDAHMQYALRVAIERRARSLASRSRPRRLPRPPDPRRPRRPRRAASYGLEEFRSNYNGHNIGGPRGGPPWLRRKYRQERPAGAPPPQYLDRTRDWAGEFARHTGKAYHTEPTFIEAYCAELQQLVGAVGARLPTARDCWVDVKMHGGRRGEFRAIYRMVQAVSRARATAGSIRDAEAACKRRRGQRR